MKHIYRTSFGLRPPYQFLVDGTMCQASLQHKFDLQTRLPVVLGEPVRLMVTVCTMNWLRAQAKQSSDPNITGASLVGRRLELRRCRHKPMLSVDYCIKDLVGSTNPFHYGVITNDDTLKEEMRKIVGVPIVYLERTFPLLEAPTKLTMDEVRRKEIDKLKVSRAEEAVISKEFGSKVKTTSEKAHKHRKAKAPNPLSVKKPSKAKAFGTSVISTNDCKKKRKRRRKIKELPISA